MIVKFFMIFNYTLLYSGIPFRFNTLTIYGRIIAAFSTCEPPYLSQQL